jgi:tripartite-type tricarboxylate transporter receptor subunit TctC
MKTLRSFLAAASATFLLSLSPTGHAAEPAFPSKPVRIIVPFGTGAMVDLIPRELATQLSAKWGQSVIVENKPGAASMIGAEYVAHSPADGYTLLMATSSTLSVAPFLYKNLRFDPLKDLTAVTLISTAPNILMVARDLPVNSVSELVALAKSRPDELSYASAGVGGILHLQSELFLETTGTKMIHVPYPGSQQAVGDLSTGRVQMMIDIMASNMGNLQDGRLKPLASMTRERLPQFPDLPTIGEAGYPDLVTDLWFGLAAPTGTPAAVIDKLQRDISEVVRSPQMRDKYAALGMNMVGSTPAQMQELASKDGERWHRVIDTAGIRVD